MFTENAAGLHLSGRFAADQSNRVLKTLGISTFVFFVMLVGIINFFNPRLSVISSIAAPIWSLAFSAIIIFGLRGITQARTGRDAKWLAEKIRIGLSNETADPQ